MVFAIDWQRSTDHFDKAISSQNTKYNRGNYSIWQNWISAREKWASNLQDKKQIIECLYCT